MKDERLIGKAGESSRADVLQLLAKGIQSFNFLSVRVVEEDSVNIPKSIVGKRV